MFSHKWLIYQVESYIFFDIASILKLGYTGTEELKLLITLHGYTGWSCRPICAFIGFFNFGFSQYYINIRKWRLELFFFYWDVPLYVEAMSKSLPFTADRATR